MSKHYPLHPGQTRAEPLYATIPLDEYEGLKKKIRSLENELATTNAMLEQRNADVARLTSQFGWRSYKDDPPKANGKDDFIFCGHQRYAYQSEAETEYFVDEGYLDMDGTLCMFNDWHEGQEIFEIDYWFPLPMHPDEPKKETKEDT